MGLPSASYRQMSGPRETGYPSPPMNAPRANRILPWAILAIAVAVRAAVWAEWRGWPGSAVAVLDPAWHLAWGARIAAGDWVGGGETWSVAPGLAYFFALVQEFAGPGTVVAAAALLIVDLGVVEVIRRLGERLGGLWVGTIAGLAAAVCAPLPFHATSLLGVSPPALLLGVAGLLALRSEPRWTALAAGLALGLSCWFRPNQLLLLPVFALVAAWPSPRKGPRAAAVALGLLLALAPALVRNRAVGGEWVPLSANAGANLYMAQEPGSWTLEAQPPPGPINLDHISAWFKEGAERAAGRPLRPGEVDRYWMEQAKSRISNDPGGFLRRSAARFYVGLATWSVHDHGSYAAHRRDLPVLGALPDPSWLLPGLAAVGAGLGWRRGRRREVVLLAGIVLGIAASLAPFTVVERYRISAQVASLPLAAAALAWIAAERHARALAAALAISLGLSGDPFRGRLVLPDALTFKPAISWTEQSGARREAMENYNVGAALIASGDRDLGLEFLARAADLGDVDAAQARCGLLLKTDTPAAASAACARATELAPDRGEAWYQLGLARWGLGDLDGAADALTRALSRKPDLPREALTAVQIARAARSSPGAPGGIEGGSSAPGAPPAIPSE